MIFDTQTDYNIVYHIGWYLYKIKKVVKIFTVYI